MLQVRLLCVFRETSKLGDNAGTPYQERGVPGQRAAFCTVDRRLGVDARLSLLLQSHFFEEK